MLLVMRAGRIVAELRGDEINEENVVFRRHDRWCRDVGRRNMTVATATLAPTNEGARIRWADLAPFIALA